MMFSRAARRAKLRPEMTQGFSPHARLALCPPLPVGVIALSEPADFWFDEWKDDSLAVWNEHLPNGIKITDAKLEGSGEEWRSLNKLCAAAEYRIEPLQSTAPEIIASSTESALASREALLGVSVEEGCAVISSNDLERCGPSFMVKNLIAAEIISGWSDLLITRTTVGAWNDKENKVIAIF